jgi:TP901 family phage tail tape measure protein
MTTAGGAITGSLGLATKAAGDFGKGMAEIQSLGVKDMTAVTEAVKKVSTTYGIDLRDSIRAAYDSLSNGVKENDIGGFLSKSAEAAKAGMTSLEVAAKHGAAMVSTFGGDIGQYFDQAFIAVKSGVLRFEELAEGMGNVTPMAKAAGLSTKELYGWLATLTTQGLKSELGITGIRSALSNLIKPSSQAAELAKQLGLDFSVTALKAKGLEGFLNDVKKATGGNVEQMSILFGDVQGLNAVMASVSNEGGAKLNDIMKEMNGTGSALSDAFKIIKENDPTLAFKQLQSQLQVLSVEIGNAVLPALGKIVEFLTPIVKGISDWVRENPNLATTIGVAAGALGTFMLVAGPLLIALPGIVTAAGLVSSALGMGGMAAAATTAAGTIGATGLGGAAVAATAAIAGPGALLVAGGAAIIMLGGIAIAAKKAWDAKQGLIKVEETYTGQVKFLTDLLDKKNIAYDKEKMAAMDMGQKITYLNEVYGKHNQAVNTSAQSAVTAWEKQRDALSGVIDELGKKLQQGEIDQAEYEAAVVGAQMRVTKAYRYSQEEMKKMFDAAIAAGDKLAEFFRDVGTASGNTGLTQNQQLGNNATGTNNWRGGMTWVGENGKELVNLPQGSQVFDNKSSMAMAGAGGGGGITINGPMISGVTLAGDMDVDRLVKSFTEKLNAKLARKGIR